MQHERHNFFLQCPELRGASPKIGAPFKVMDNALVTRMYQVLRLRPTEHVTFFFDDTSIEIVIDQIECGKKAYAIGQVVQMQQHHALKPEIHLLCGLTKKTTFEEIVYTATQLGVTSIIPLKTTKSYEKIYTEKDYERFCNIMIAAAEQSKQIILPTLAQPQSFENALNNARGEKINFDPMGKKLSIQISTWAKTSPQIFTLIFGAEGGLTVAELERVEEAGFEHYLLTPSILRTQDAIEVGVGLLRCLV